MQDLIHKALNHKHWWWTIVCFCLFLLRNAPGAVDGAREPGTGGILPKFRCLVIWCSLVWDHHIWQLPIPGNEQQPGAGACQEWKHNLNPSRSQASTVSTIECYRGNWKKNKFTHVKISSQCKILQVCKASVSNAQYRLMRTISVDDNYDSDHWGEKNIKIHVTTPK